MVKPKKHLGQHFLTDQNIAERTAILTNKSNVENVLEIGPGKGILTKHLLNQPNKHGYRLSLIKKQQQQKLIRKNKA